MELFLIFILAICLFILWRYTVRLKKRLDVLESGSPVENKGPVLPALREKPLPVSKTRPVSTRSVQDAAPSLSSASEAAPSPPRVSVPQQGTVPPVKKARSPLWEKIEKGFIENWTGIVGAIVMVLGIAFLAVYAALKLLPVGRFIMLLFFCAGLMALHLFLNKREGWARVAALVRSSAGAIFLFACLGAGGIEGLQFIESTSIALALLVGGILVNVLLGFRGPTQVFASFHVIISLAALSVAPATPVTLAIGAAVVLLAIVMSYRSPWEYHLLVTVAGFLAYHLFWYHRYPDGALLVEWGLPRLTGIAATAVIGVAACFVHYRKLYRDRTFHLPPFLAHLANWSAMGAGFLIYATGSKWNTLVLAAAGAAACALSWRAKSLSIRWLRVTDMLVGQALLMAAIGTLGRWGADDFVIAAAIHAEAFIFLLVMIIEKDALLRRIGVFLHYLCLGALILASLGFIPYASIAVQARIGIVLSLMLILEVIFHRYSFRHAADRIDIIGVVGSGDNAAPLSIGGVLLSFLFFALAAVVHEFLWSGYALAALAALLIWYRRRLGSPGLGIGVLIIAAGLECMALSKLISVSDNAATAAIYGAPFFAVPVALFIWSRAGHLGRRIFWPGVYLFTIHLVFYTYFTTNGLSPFIPGVIWLIASLVYLECAMRTASGEENDTGPSSFVLHGGYALVALFILRHLLVHLQSELYIGPVKVRLLVELFAIPALLYWAAVPSFRSLPSTRAWKVHPLFWEICALFLLLTVALEVPSAWHPMAWALMAFLFFGAGLRWKERLSRFRFYSVVMMWITAIHVAVVSTTAVTPSLKLGDQPWIAGTLALLLLFAYAPVYYRFGGLDNVAYPWDLKGLRRLVGSIQRRRNLFIFYPLFVATFLFLYWSFDKSLLTLLWVVEAFAVFILSLVLRENHFRYLSMAGLVLCLGRLIFYDLSQAGTLARALVFLGVGAIMLAMNMLYNKYRDRFNP